MSGAPISRWAHIARYDHLNGADALWALLRRRLAGLRLNTRNQGQRRVGGASSCYGGSQALDPRGSDGAKIKRASLLVGRTEDLRDRTCFARRSRRRLHFFRLGFGKSDLNRLPRLPQGPRAARLSHEARACIDTMGTQGPEAKTKPRFFVSLRGAGALSKLERD